MYENDIIQCKEEFTVLQADQNIYSDVQNNNQIKTDQIRKDQRKQLSLPLNSEYRKNKGIR